MFTLILALNYQHAGVCAFELGLKFNEWRYIRQDSDLLGYRPRDNLRVVAYTTAPSSMRMAARYRGFDIVEFMGDR